MVVVVVLCLNFVYFAIDGALDTASYTANKNPARTHSLCITAVAKTCTSAITP